MKLVRGLHNLPAEWQHSVVTIGTFDGLHRGHQALITQCVRLAAAQNVAATLVTFEPYPKSYFAKNRGIPRLMTLRDKFIVLQSLGIDYLWVLTFNAALATSSAEDFISKILVNTLQAKVVVVGDDFHFGANRRGDYALLQSYGQQYGFTVEQFPTYQYNGERVSSSRLRQALERGNLSLATTLLGRPYHLSGRVVVGDQRGRRFGFPTANIATGQRKLLLSGIFVVTVAGISAELHPAVASVGWRPMYPSDQDLLEVHLLDFNRNIYHQHCTVHFLQKLRDEQFFSSEAELIQQIKDDVAQAQAFFTK